MKLKNFFRLFWDYLKSRWQMLTAFGIFIVIFLIILSLSHVPLSTSSYAAVLSAALGFVLLLMRFYPYYKKCERLMALNRQCATHLTELPHAGDLLETSYQQLVIQLDEARNLLLEEQKKRERDAIHYYTMWAHQIKTPISAIRLLLQERPSTPENQSLALELFKIEQYVEMVLQYLRLGNGSNDLSFTTHSLEELVRQAVKRTAPLFIHKKLTLDLKPIDETVITDEKWLVFILEQLLTNAVKYTQKGSVSIYLDQTQPDTLVIADTGIGIRAEDLPRIFEFGYTGYNGHLDKRATGIGLYLCREMANLLSHTITVQSQPGKGSRVLLSFGREKLEIE